MKNSITQLTILLITMFLVGCTHVGSSGYKSNESALYGKWTYQESYKVDGSFVYEYYEITRKEDYSLTVKKMTLDHSNKTYSTEVKNGTWKISGDNYIEKFATDGSMDTYEIIELSDNVFTTSYGNSSVIERKNNSYTLPKPPAGYSKG